MWPIIVRMHKKLIHMFKREVRVLFSYSILSCADGTEWVHCPREILERRHVLAMYAREDFFNFLIFFYVAIASRMR